MLAIVVVTAALGLVIVGIFKAIEQVFFAWVQETGAMGRASPRP